MADYLTEHQLPLTTLNAAERGWLQFALGDLQGLSSETLTTNATPWKLAVTALLVQAQGGDENLSLEQLPALLNRYGLVTSPIVANWPNNLPKPTNIAVGGLMVGTIERGLPRVQVEGANFGCAVCHAGRLYDASGQPTQEWWLGLPNTSVNIDLYINELYTAMGWVDRNPEQALAALQQLFPRTTPNELKTLRRFVLPAIRQRLADTANLNRAVPFIAGYPGITNGFASLKFQLGLLDAKQMAAEHAFTAVPGLDYRHWRSGILYDNAYTPNAERRFEELSDSRVSAEQQEQLAQIISFITVPTEGVDPKRAINSLPQTRDILAFIRQYRSPNFPGTIQSEKLSAGKQLYDKLCSDCHGRYNDSLDNPTLLALPNRPDNVGTDAVRRQAFDEVTIAAIEKTPYKNVINVDSTNTYVAPPLSGLWASAPYLHNGSVPTIWHLLNPSERPTVFEIGGHSLDYDKLGIKGELSDGAYRYSENYQAWSQSVLLDTRQPGLGNQGHEFGSELNAAQQRELIEYLKIL